MRTQPTQRWSNLVVQTLVCAFLLLAPLASAADTTWLTLVSPILTNAEKKTYRSLPPEARASFEENFWTGKSITAEEYFKRVQFIDSAFGSSKPASGANTDPGRVYLALGPPTKITRLPSSRIFVPLEIWYYDIVPGILNTELRIIFYQKNSLGLPKLYSPTTDTIRALLVPQAATVGAFGPNDSISESDIRNALNVPPAEDEVISAAVNVATGIKYTGNDEILGQITSPETILRKNPETRVTSRLILNRPKLDVIESPSPYGGSQIDFKLQPSAQRQIDIEILEDTATVYKNQIHLNFPKAQPVDYTHRLDLLPGDYQVMFTIDGKNYAYPLIVKPAQTMSDIFRTDAAKDVDRRKTPFEFAGKQANLNASGKYAAVALPSPAKVTWILRRGAEVLWRSISDLTEFAVVELPVTGLAPGAYQLEAITENDSRTTEYMLGKDTNHEVTPPEEATLLSFNANLAPAMRHAFIGHQWLLRGQLAQARKSLESSIQLGATADAEVELARVEALSGGLDQARDRIRRVLAVQPNDFQALSVLAYIETKFQDFTVAAELYRRALAVQDSPALRTALAQLPKQ